MLYAKILINNVWYFLGASNTLRGVNAIADGNLLHLERAGIDVYDYKTTKINCEDLPSFQELI